MFATSDDSVDGFLNNTKSYGSNFQDHELVKRLWSYIRLSLYPSLVELQLLKYYTVSHWVQLSFQSHQSYTLSLTNRSYLAVYAACTCVQVPPPRWCSASWHGGWESGLYNSSLGIFITDKNGCWLKHRTCYISEGIKFSFVHSCNIKP